MSCAQLADRSPCCAGLRPALPRRPASEALKLIRTREKREREQRSEAQKEANRDGVPPIELIDGERLVSLFEKYELGLKPKTVHELVPEFFRELRELSVPIRPSVGSRLCASRARSFASARAPPCDPPNASRALASIYGQARPTYPPELVRWCLEQAPSPGLNPWTCPAGTGISTRLFATTPAIR